MSKDSHKILIGLGGTGADCIQSMKRVLRTQMENDSEKMNSRIQFLGIDTDDDFFLSSDENEEESSAKDSGESL